jgi:SAM-dependent methyltransferase/uncharacterized protein YbaR (Trm112 family)
MRRAFFDLLPPRCPACRQEVDWRLEAWSEPAGHLLHGRLHCPDPGCAAAFPVIDGMPVLVGKPEEALARHAAAWLRREDLPPGLDQSLNAASGVGGWSDAGRQQLSTYLWDHYGDLDPEAHDEDFPPGSVTRVLDQALALLSDPPEGPALDIGCGPGRAALHLASRTGLPTLGVDVNPIFLRAAHGVLADGKIRYDLRRCGVSYLRREHPVILPAVDLVDFWFCDAAELPFADDSFGLVVCLHALDSAADPAALLRELTRVIRPGGILLASTPYDWSAAVTPPALWWGGAPAGGDPVDELRQAFDTAGLEILAERDEVPWLLRLHDRAGMHYRCHLVAARVL